MPANATTILAAVEAALRNLYPDLPVQVAKRPVAGNKPPLGGWNPGWKAPGFVISAIEAESVDDDGSFEEVSVRYAVTVEFVKPSAAVTAGGTDPTLNEDTEIRDKRQGVRNLLYTPRIAGLDVANAGWKAHRTYDIAGTGGAPVQVSGQTVWYEVMEGRPA